MLLKKRKHLLLKLGSYLITPSEAWQQAKHKAYLENNWFVPEFIHLACRNIATSFLTPLALEDLIEKYKLPDQNPHPVKVGIVMAGNIPLVGFHDFLCVFLSGHIANIKASSKDAVLITHLVKKLHEWEPETISLVSINDMIRNCDAYIATGSNNSGRYFEYYFGKYPSIIRRNRTSAAILTGEETPEELRKLADDVFQYFGLGCRNVTKIYVPEGYDFIPLLRAFDAWQHLADHNKFKNNYEYNLAVHILNNKFYMSNAAIILVEDASLFSPIAQLNYEFYQDIEAVKESLRNNDSVQCVAGAAGASFGSAQLPGICDFADGVDTMSFLTGLTANVD